MRKLFSRWNPDIDFFMEDSRKISIALIIAGMLGFFLKQVDFANAILAVFTGLILWAYAIQKR